MQLSGSKLSYAEDININFKLFNKAFLFYNPKSNQEEFYYDVKDEGGNLLKKFGCSTFGDDIKSFKETFSASPYYFDYAKIDQYLSEIRMEKLVPDYFSYSNNLPICFVFSNTTNKIVNISHAYFNSYGLTVPDSEKKLLPNMKYTFRRDICKGYLQIEKNSDVPLRLDFSISGVEDKNYLKNVQCKSISSREGYCNVSNSSPTYANFSISLPVTNAKYEQFEFTFDCNVNK